MMVSLHAQRWNASDGRGEGRGGAISQFPCRHTDKRQLGRVWEVCYRFSVSLSSAFLGMGDTCVACTLFRLHPPSDVENRLQRSGGR